MSARPVHALWDTTTAPRQLGKYLLSHVLGEGAMGIVYKAQDPHILRPVAVKAIRAPLLGPGAQDIAAAARFRTEAQAAGRLSHPNIVSIYEYGETAHERYIAMEYVDGVSLLELSRRLPRLPLEDALSLLLQLLGALECAHAQGVWHRDIKPANLLITPDGRLKVSDFGIARIESADRTHHTTVLGSPGYMAPERYTDDAPDQRVDIFSCGVLLHELLTGEAPFRGSSSVVMYQVLNQQPPAPSSLPLEPPVPARFDAVVQRAMAKRPADRYASAAQMREALLAAADRPIPPTLSLATLLRLRPAREDAPTQVLAPRDPVPVSSLPSLPGIERAQLAELEALLLPLLGPMARLVLRDAARQVPELHALIAHVAEHALDERDGARFLAEAARRFPVRQAAPRSVPSRPLPVLGSTPMAPEVIEQARHVLAEEIGPLASLIVKRAAAVPTREQFFALLVDQAGDEVDRKALLARLWKIA